jgi:ribosomal protein L22
LPISGKYAMAICNMIRGKNIEQAMILLEKAEKMKIAVPMRGEIAHKKGMMSGKYPVKASGHFIILLKSLKSNALVNELELEKYKIFCRTDLAPRPYKRFGNGQFKRAHVEVRLIPITKGGNK